MAEIPAKHNPRKDPQIDLIEDRLRNAPAAILADYRGLNVADLANLRGQLRPMGAEFRVVKNTLARIAADRAGIEGLDDLLEGPTAITFTGDDIGAPTRTLRDFARTSRVLALKGAVLGGRTLSADETNQLADLPSMSQLQAQLVGNIQGALAGVVGVLDGALSGLVYTFEARAKQLEAA